MLSTSSPLKAQLEACLGNKKIPNRKHASYTKWFRFCLGFCNGRVRPSFFTSQLFFVENEDATPLGAIELDAAS